MIERFGNVVYWTGCAAATGFFGLGLFSGLERESPETVVVGTATGAVCWVIGRAVRYILCNR